ncbi:MAG: hypothetical protein ABI886_09835 [Betaproteobacteria bacterium]
MDTTNAIAVLLRPLLAARNFAPQAPAAAGPEPAVAQSADAARERADALREAHAHDERARRNLWLAAPGGRRNF